MEIDIVFTYVDHTDEEWRRKRDKHLPDSDENTARFDDSLEEIRYALRSIDAHLKFKYRRIYFVTNNGALPWFVKPAPDMIPILYSDLTGCESYNSNTIEAHLHKIEGLSEYYLYFNDDTILTRDLYLQDLIHPHTGDLMWYAESDPLFSFVSRHPVISQVINFISALPIINRVLDNIPMISSVGRLNSSLDTASESSRNQWFRISVIAIVSISKIKRLISSDAWMIFHLSMDFVTILTGTA